MSDWRPFTSAVHEAVAGALAAAEERAHPLAAPEHLLLALHAAGGGAGRALSRLRVGEEVARAWLDAQAMAPAGRRPARLSRDALAALGRALAYGEDYGAPAADTQHVLLALWDGDSAASRLLAEAGVDGASLRAAVAALPRPLRAGEAPGGMESTPGRSLRIVLPDAGDVPDEEQGRPVLAGFSGQAEAVVFAAQSAGGPGGRVGPEHLLLGLLAAAPHTLVSLLGADDLEAVRERALDHLHGPGRLGPYAARGAVDAIEAAVAEAAALGASLVTPGHLLLGLVLAAPDVVAAAVFDARGLSQRLRAALRDG